MPVFVVYLTWRISVAVVSVPTGRLLERLRPCETETGLNKRGNIMRATVTALISSAGRRG